ncbi:MAG: PAS domain S-box protein [candidate division Zixibacteria bacterium]|nr:PAS domain S-box protein [candidate division Zixibacteria bacterium]
MKFIEQIKHGNNLRAIILIPLGLLVFSIIGASVFIINKQIEEHTQMRLKKRYGSIKNILAEIQKDETSKLRLTGESIIRESGLGVIIPEADSKSISKILKPYVLKYFNDGFVSHLLVFDDKGGFVTGLEYEGGKSTAAHVEKGFDFDLSRLNGIDISGLDLLSCGEVSIASVVPIEQNGQVKGYLEIAGSYPRFLKRLNTLMQSEMAVFFEHDGQSKRLGFHTFETGEPGITDELNSLSTSGNEQFEFAERSFRVQKISLYDVRKGNIGELLLLNDITPENRALEHSINSIIIVGSALALVLLWFLYKFLGIIQKRLRKAKLALEEEWRARVRDKEDYVKELEVGREELLRMEQTLKDRVVELAEARGNALNMKDRAEDARAEAEEAARKIRELSNRNEIILETIPDIIIGVDPRKRIDWANSTALKVLGGDIINGQCRSIPVKIVEKLLSGNITEAIEETWVECTDDRKRLIEWRCQAMKDEKTDNIEVIAAGRDITERHDAAKTLRESRRKYRDLYEGAQAGLFRTRISDGKILDCNRQFAEMFGYEDMGEFLDKFATSENYVDAGTRDKMLEIIESSGELKDFEARFRRRDGSILYGRYSGRIYPEKGYIEGVFIDITEAKKYESELAASEQRYRSLIRSIDGAASFIFDRELRFVLAEGTEIEKSGYLTENFEGKALRETLPKELCDTLEPHYKAALDGRKSGGEFEFGDQRYNFQVTPSKDEDGNVTGGLVFVRNITFEYRNQQDVKRLVSIVESSDDAIIGKDLNGRILTWNPGAERLYGYSADEIIGKNISLLLPESSSDETGVMLDRVSRGEKFHNYETRRRRKDGKIIDVSLTVSPIKNEDGRVIGASTIARDITERIRAEKALAEVSGKRKELEDIVRHSPVIAFLWRADENWSVEYVSENIDQFGYSAEDFTSGRVQFASLVHPEDLHRVAEEVKEFSAEEGRESFRQEYRVVHRDGFVRWIEDRTWIRRDKHGNITHYQGLIWDINEWKVAQEGLAKSETKYRSLFEHMLNGYAYCRIITDENNNPVDLEYININDAFCAITGIKRDTVVGRKLTEVFPGIKDTEYHFLDIYGRVALGGVSEKFEVYFEPLNKWLSISIFSPQSGYFIAVFEDITGRKNAEMKLRQMSKVFMDAADPIIIESLDGVILNLNKEVERIYGWTREEIINQPIDVLVPDDFAEPSKELLERCKKHEEIKNIEGTRITKSGERLNVLLTLSLLSSEDGKPTAVASIAKDITELKRVEMQYKTMLEASIDGFCVFNIEGRFVDANKAFLDMIGCNLEELSTKTVADIDGKFDAEGIKQCVDEIIEKGFLRIETLLKHSNGSTTEVELSANFIPISGGKVYVFVRDISERLRAEAIIKEREEQYRLLADNIQDLICIHEVDGIYKYVSPSVKELLGYEPDELIGISPYDLFHPDDAIRIRNESHTQSLNRQDTKITYRIRRKDGKYIWFESFTRPLLDEAGGLIGLQTCSRDVTDRITAEHDLKNSEERLRELFNNMRSGVAMLEAVDGGEDFLITDVNKASLDIEGLSRDELVGRRFKETFPSSVKLGFYDILKRVWETGKSEEFPSVFYHDDRIANWRDSYVYRLSSGEIVVIYDDVTGQKQSEEDIRRYQEELELRNEIANTFLAYSGDDDVFAEVMEICLKKLKSLHGVFGYINKAGDLVSPSLTRDVWNKCEVPDKSLVFPRESWAGIWGNALVEGKTLISNEQLNVPGGHIPMNRVIAVPILHHGEVIGLIMVANKDSDYNNSDRKMLETIAAFISPILDAKLRKLEEEEIRRRAEDELKASEERLAAVITKSPIPTVVFSNEGQLTSYNEAAEKLVGYEYEEIRNVEKWLEALYPNDQYRNAVYEEISRLRRHGSAGRTEFTVATKNGQRRYVDFKISVFSEGHIVQMADITERRHAEEALKIRLMYEQALQDLSQALLYEDDISKAIHNAFEALLKASEASRIYLFENFEDVSDGMCMRQVYEICADGISPEIDNPGLQHVPYNPGFTRWWNNLNNNKPVSGIVRDFPEPEQEILKSQHILSILVLPLWVGGKFYGYIGFDDTTREREWGEENIKLLTTAAEMIGSYISRKQFEEKLKRFRTALDNSADSIFIINFETMHFEDVNKVACESLDYSREELLTKGPADIKPEFSIGELRKEFERIMASPDGFGKLETMHRRRDGVDFPVEVFIRSIKSDNRTMLVAIARDITERKRAEAELREYAQKLAVHFKYTPLGVIEWDTEMRVTDWNPAAEKIFGYSREEMLGQHPSGKILPAEIEDELSQLWQRILSGEGGLHNINENTTKDGRICICEWYNTVLTDTEGNTLGVASLVEDVTEKRHNEESLRGQLRFLETLVNTIPDPLFFKDKRGVYLGCNQAFSRIILGLEPDRVVGRTVFDLPNEIPAELAKKYHSADMELLDNPGVQVYEAEVKCADDIVRDFRFSKATYSDSEGKPAGIIGVMLDLTESKKAEQAIRESEKKYRSVFESFMDLYFQVDTNGEIITVSPSCKHLMGYDPDELIGKATSEIYYYPEEREELLKGLYKSGLITDREIYMKNKDGKPVPCSLNAKLVADEKGDPVRIEGTIRDITERKKAEEEISKFKTISDRASYGTGIASPDGTLIYVNEHFAKMHGYDTEELIGKPLDIFHTEEQLKEVREINKGMLETGSFNSREIWHVTRDGREFPTLMNGVVIFDENGNPQFIAATAIDITERMLVEEALRISEERLALATRGTGIGVWDYNVEEDRLEWDERMFSLFGVDRESFNHTFEDWKNCVLPEALPKALDDFQSALSGETEFRIEFPILRSDGEKRWLAGAAAITRDEDGKPVRVVGVNFDITERKIAETKLKEAYRFQEMILETVATAVFTVDNQCNITSVNEEFSELVGYAPEEIVGKPCTILQGDRCMNNCSLLDESIPKPIQKKECVVTTRNGRRLTILKNANSITDDNGDVIGGIESFIDITKLIEAKEATEQANIELENINAQLEDAIKQANDMALRAESASIAKSEFLANMSHEIRTPMNGVIGMTELALGTELTSEQRGYLDLVKSSADNLLTIINDILDFSKVEAGQLELENVDFSLRECIEQAMDTLAFRAYDKGVELVNYIAPLVPDNLVGDPTRLRQIIINLVGNAIKFTDEGEVVFRAEMESQSEQGLLFHFSISDTGIGIPEERQKSIFESFTQADGSTTRKYGGTGLGTTISKQLVEMMQGSIWVESPTNPNPDVGGPGSTFHFTAYFDLQKESRTLVSAKEESTVELDGLKVLVVDDNDTNRKLLSAIFENWSFNPHTANNGQEALDMLIHAQKAGEPFRLAIIDSLMPVMNGMNTVENIRANPAVSGTKIIILTSAGLGEERKKYRRLGVDGYLTKPIKQSVLFNAISEAMGEKTTEKIRQVESEVDTKEDNEHVIKRHILLAEDNPVNQKLAVRLLEKRGHTVVVVEDGLKALSALRNEKFDLVLMDVQMPEMDGLEASIEIRKMESEQGGHIPIVAMTAHAMKGDREKCINAGMDSYVSKPIKPAELYKIIDNIEDLTPQAVDPDDDINKYPSFDMEKALEGVDGDNELLAELARDFTENCRYYMQVLKEAVDNGDSVKIAEIAHSIKGSVGNFGSQDAYEHASELEQLGRENKLEEIKPVYRKLEASVSHLIPALSILGKENASENSDSRRR